MAIAPELKPAIAWLLALAVAALVQRRGARALSAGFY
jgi:hypothetical protein